VVIEMMKRGQNWLRGRHTEREKGGPKDDRQREDQRWSVTKRREVVKRRKFE